MDRLLTEPAEMRAFLEDYYGRPEAALITPHQRMAAALRHEESDRVPFDFWAVPEVWAALRCYLDTDDDADVLRLLGVDCRSAGTLPGTGPGWGLHLCFGPLYPGRHAPGEYLSYVHRTPGASVNLGGVA